MRKRILLTVLALVILIAALGAVKALQIGRMIDQGKRFTPPPEIVTSTTVRADTWDTGLTSVGTLTAVQGVTVAAELAGKVVRIAFESGSQVRKGDLLIQQDTTSEEAQLPGALSQADHDTAVSNTAQAQAQVDNLRATIAKKTIRAPFGGRLGIRQVNLGQMLREGDIIVTLQSLDPIYVDFSLPQQQLAQLRPGQPVRVTCDALPGETVEGRITAITPLVDSETRNIRVEATVGNRAKKLRPGMFVNVAVGLPLRQKVLAIPATAVLYAPYSDSVFVIEDSKEGKRGRLLRQQFVRLGEKRGDFVVVTSGVHEGDTIVSTGVFKLRNGQSVVIDNRLAPLFRQAPRPENN